jgi:hypothetical protein
MKTTKDVWFRDYYVRVKAGTPIHQTGMGFYVDPKKVDAGAMGKFGEWSIFNHDAIHYYIWINADDVETVPQNLPFPVGGIA